jgi:hypothetical protein
MATVLEECITEDQRPIMRFFCAKRLSEEDIYKEMCFIFVGKCLSHKAVPP